MFHGFGVFFNTAELLDGEFRYLGFVIFDFLLGNFSIFA